MPHRHFIVGTAGHIDHGKSSLVKALTGTDPDRLPEERERGMTIDLGFAHLDLPHPADPTTTFSLGIIDVPGHADFVKNMVAGVGGIDVALLAVAADDSWMPQTEEHVQILSYLGVRHAVIALTKADAVDDHGLAEMDVREHLEGTPFAEAPIVPTSVVTGAGLDRLRSTLAGLLAAASPPPDIGKPRLAVDRVFSVRGIGTVVTGTLIGGCFAKGQPAVVQPLGIESRVRNLQSHNHDVDRALPGTRTALNLQNVAVASRHDKQGVRRGDVVTAPGLGPASHCAGVRIDKLRREIAGQPASARPLRHGMRVRFHHGGAAHSARLFFLEADRRELAAGESAPAQLRFEEPALCFAGDRFVLRDWGMHSTIAGGIVLDPAAARRGYRAPARLAFLQDLAAAPDDPLAHLRSLLARDRAVRRASLLSRSRFSADEVDRAVGRLLDEHDAAEAGAWLVEADWWNRLHEQAARLVDARHRATPQAEGLPLTELSAALSAAFDGCNLFETLTQSLASSGFRVAGKFVARDTHRPTLPEDLARAAERIRAQLAADPLNPPGIAELAASPPEREALRFLIDTGELVRLDDKVAISGAVHDQLVADIRSFIRDHGRATASDLRQATGTTRRIMIPLLERLDAQRVTIRQGDVRTLPR